MILIIYFTVHMTDASKREVCVYNRLEGLKGDISLKSGSILEFKIYLPEKVAHCIYVK